MRLVILYNSDPICYISGNWRLVTYLGARRQFKSQGFWVVYGLDPFSLQQFWVIDPPGALGWHGPPQGEGTGSWRSPCAL